MRAFKFRSSAKIEFALDIIFNQRLHCAEWSKLNDPMEGLFAYSYSTTMEPDPRPVVLEKERLKICSLSQNQNCALLWAHYASGFDGVAVEVELPNATETIRAVTYRKLTSFVTEVGTNLGGTAREILSSKFREWKYEQEVRILSEQEWFPLPTPVQRVICGHRMHPALFEALRLVCCSKGIRMEKTKIGERGVETVPVTDPEFTA